MQTWLRERPLPLPRVVTSAPDEHPKEHGVLVLPKDREAALVLEAADGSRLRVTWERDAEGTTADRRRAVPSGTYRILGLRQVDRSEEGKVWHTSATGAQLGELEVQAGERQEVQLDRTIEIGRGLVRGRQVAMTITHPSGAGLSIYADGLRISIGYKLLAGDEVVRKGRMNYG